MLKNDVFYRQSLRLEVTGIISELVNKYYYKPLPIEESEKYRKYYQSKIPECFIIKPNSTFYIVDYDTNKPIATNYERIVIGDYGPFIEIKDEDIIKENVVIKPGETKRLSREYSKCKYYWYCPISNSNTKLYKQKRTVRYADYKIGYWYASPYDVEIMICEPNNK